MAKKKMPSARILPHCRLQMPLRLGALEGEGGFPLPMHPWDPPPPLNPPLARGAAAVGHCAACRVSKHHIPQKEGGGAQV